MKKALSVVVGLFVGLVAQAQEPIIFTGHGSGVNHVKVFPNSTRVFSAGGSELLEWDFESFQVIKRASYNNTIDSLAISPNGQQYALAFWYNNSAWLYLSPDKNPIREFFGHGGRVYAVAFSPDGKYLLTGSEDKTAKLWDVETGQSLRTFTGHTSNIGHVAFSPDGTRIITASDDRTAKVWSVQDGLKPIWTLSGHTNSISAVLFSPDGKKIATGSYDETIRIWDSSAGKLLVTLQGHTAGIFWEAMTFSPDSKFLLSGSEDGSAILWNVETGLNVREFKGFQKYSTVRGVAFSNDGTKIIAGSTDATIRIWDISDLLVPIPTLLETPYDCNQATAEANGFTAAAPASADFSLAPVQFKKFTVGVGDQEFTDGNGGAVTLSPNTGVMFYCKPMKVDRRDYVFIRVSIRSSDSRFSPALGVLNAAAGVPDGSMGLNLELNGSRFVNQFDVLSAFIEPESDSIMPILQFAGMPGGDNVTVEFDDIEIYRMPKTIFPVIPKNRNLFGAKTSSHITKPLSGFIRSGDRILNPVDLTGQN